MKREEQHDMSLEAFEVERNVVQQSSLPSTVRRDNCVYRDDSELKIQRSATRDYTAVDTASHLLEEHAKEIRNYSKHARNILSSKSLGAAEVEHLSQQLPGGLWRTSPTRDHGMSRQQAELLNPQEQLPKYDSEKEIDDENLEIENTDWNNLQKNTGDPQAKKTTKGVEVFLQPSKLLEEKKARAKSQVAVYRRLFMDIEREQVRENIRMKEHRKRMETLKVEKEVERLEIEQRQIDKLKIRRVRKEEESFLRVQKEKKREMDLAKQHKKTSKREGNREVYRSFTGHFEGENTEQEHCSSSLVFLWAYNLGYKPRYLC
ncbi:Coiled-coil domain containing 15 [Desmophyllum pertusum]|uniref:Coiled-coil domain containing 15 n=1 Tax=Desmophyllum pertusum TaxID=174260 RepID=A0A9X0D5B9_9CNID|nr:Coiled-coil domain containing 15 [Desmophyllum pertusum]